MTATHRWPPLERRIIETLPSEPPGPDRTELLARLEVIPGAGHAANLDNPPVFNRVLRDFLDSLPPDGAR